MFADSNADLDIDAIKQGHSLGISPVDGTKVFGAPMAFMSESALDGDEKGLKISRIILSKEITEENITQLLCKRKNRID